PDSRRRHSRHAALPIVEPEGEAAFRRELEGDKARWKTRTIQGAALLPHIDEYIKRGHLLRAYDAANDLRGAFGPKDVWKLVDPRSEEHTSELQSPDHLV